MRGDFDEDELDDDIDVDDLCAGEVEDDEDLDSDDELDEADVEEEARAFYEEHAR